MNQPKLKWYAVAAHSHWVAYPGSIGPALQITPGSIFVAGTEYQRDTPELHDVVNAMVFAERKLVERVHRLYGDLIDIKLP